MFAQETKTVKLYSFDSNGIYCGAFDYKWEVGTGIAANSTLEIPPEAQEGFVCVWNNQSWELKEDHRDKVVYSTLDRSESKVDYIGSIKEEYTLLKPSTEFDLWNGTDWIDPRTPTEIESLRLAQFPALKRRQFMRVLVLNGFDLDQIESEINQIQDTQTRQLALIDWKGATEFWRTDETLLMVANLLGLDSARIDAIWEQALTL